MDHRLKVVEGRVWFIVLLYFGFGFSMKGKKKMSSMIILHTKLEAERTLT